MSELLYGNQLKRERHESFSIIFIHSLCFACFVGRKVAEFFTITLKQVFKSVLIRSIRFIRSNLDNPKPKGELSRSFRCIPRLPDDLHHLLPADSFFMLHGDVFTSKIDLYAMYAFVLL